MQLMEGLICNIWSKESLSFTQESNQLSTVPSRLSRLSSLAAKTFCGRENGGGEGEEKGGGKGIVSKNRHAHMVSGHTVHKAGEVTAAAR